MNLLTITEAKHFDKNGNCIWAADNLRNTLHTQGEEYMLKALFVGLSIPTTYYIGLDNRLTINQSDILAGLVGEPSTNGYIRQTLNSQGFIATLSTNWKVKTPTLLFSATGGSWGPVRNAFLTTGSANTGFLISTVVFPVPQTVLAGNSFSFRISLGIGG